MPITSKGVSYPNPSDNVDIAGDIQVLAETTETSLAAFNYNMTAAGDILTRSSTATAPIAVGATGAPLATDSTTATGLAYNANLKGLAAVVPILYQTLPAATTVTISNIPQTYDDLLIYIKVRGASGAEITYTWNGLSANYLLQGFTQRVGAVITGYQGPASASIITQTNQAAVASVSNNYGWAHQEMLLMNYSSATAEKGFVVNFNGRDGQGSVVGVWGMANSGTAALTSFTMTSTVNFDNTSTIEMYGLKK